MSIGGCSAKTVFLREDKGLKETYDVRALKESRKTEKFIFPLLIPAKSDKTEIELKSLILAQIERWRHALHMQVERQHGELALWWRVAHG